MLLGFKKQFAQPILDGTKIFTVREKRKVEPKVGETLHMYSGLRTKYTEVISKEHKLTGIQTVNILISKTMGLKVAVFIDGIQLSKTQLLVFIQSDGFKNIDDFAAFWLKGVKKSKEGFQTVIKNHLVMYHWTDFRF